MAMTVEIKGNKLCIEIDLEKPTPSASGKTKKVLGLPRCQVDRKSKKPPHRLNPGKGGFYFDMARILDPIRAPIKRP